MNRTGEQLLKNIEGQAQERDEVEKEHLLSRTKELSKLIPNFIAATEATISSTGFILLCSFFLSFPFQKKRDMSCLPTKEISPAFYSSKESLESLLHELEILLWLSPDERLVWMAKKIEKTFEELSKATETGDIRRINGGLAELKVLFKELFFIG